MSENSYYRALAVSHRLYDAYVVRGESLRVLAQKGDWNVRLLYRYFFGSYFPKLNTLAALAKILDVSVCWLLNGGKKRSYQNSNINFDTIINNKPKNKSVPPKLQTIISRLRHGHQQSISLMTAFDCEELFDIPADKLFIREQGE